MSFKACHQPSNQVDRGKWIALISHCDQAQPIRRRGRTRRGTVTRRQCRSDAIHRPAPSPTSFSVPTMLRTWWCRKLRASATISMKSPSRRTSRRSSVRNGLFAWQAAARNEENRACPGGSAPHDTSASASSSAATCQTRPTSSAGRARRFRIR